MQIGHREGHIMATEATCANLLLIMHGDQIVHTILLVFR
jgi:hypothetical protein